LLSSSVALAKGSGTKINPDCLVYYLKFGIQHLDANWRGKTTTTESTVSIGKELPGRYGGKRISLHLMGETWLARYYSAENDVQGDPRLFMFAFGEKVSEFFGFKMVSPTEIIVPDAKELDGAIQRLNKQLINDGKEPIAVRFYKSGGEEPVERYLRTIASRKALPIAMNGNPMIHDIGFHTGAIILPKAVMDDLAIRINRYFDFVAFLRERYELDPEMLEEVNTLADGIFDLLATRIDYATAQQNLLLLDKSRASIDRSHSSFSLVAQNLLGGDLWQDISQNLRYVEKNYAPYADRYGGPSGAGIEIFAKDFDDFMDDVKAKSSYKPVSLTSSQFAALQRARYRDIQEAASALTEKTRPVRRKPGKPAR